MEKAKKIFLYIGTAVVIITFISFVVVLIRDTLYNIEFNRNREFFGKGDADDEWFWAFMSFLAIPVPVLLSEIIMIKNGCILLSKDESKAKKVLSIISAVLSILLIVIVLIAMNDLVDYKLKEIILISLWLPIIVSFILTYKIKV